MSEVTMTLIVLGCICGATAIGMVIRSRQPAAHLDSESKDAVRLAMAIVGTIAALVLSLILYSTNASYNDRRDSLESMVAQVTLLDVVLAQYGPAASEVRVDLRQTVAAVKSELWRSGESQDATTGEAAVSTGGKALFAQLLALSPADEAQATLKSQAVQLAVSIGTSRQRLIAQEESRAIPVFFFVVVVAWLAMLYASFGLFAPPNRIVIGSLFLSALSVSGAILLILELAQPFHGLIRLSSVPVENVYEHLGQ